MERTIEQRAMKIRKFNRFYTNIIGLVNQTILESPYSLAEVRVLIEIKMAGECVASDLIRELQIDPGYLSRMLKRFKKEQMIQSTKLVTDGRSQLLSLTEKGMAVITTLSDESTKQIVRILECLPQDDQEKLVHHMEAVQSILSGQEDRSVQIRPHKPGDAGFIAYRHGVLYQQEYDLDPVFERYVFAGIARYLENRPAGEIWVAECAGQIVGSIAIVGVDEETAQLRWFLIEPEFRGTGLGKRLMTVAIDYCRQKNFKQVFLWTFLGLDAARHLYKSFGFSPTEQAENNTWKQQLIEERWDMTLRE
jgi:DNA-binding MarR family transcriptional regulator/GNAT superfamily N-acetyltransferase